jgi:hypothetical protein
LDPILAYDALDDVTRGGHTVLERVRKRRKIKFSQKVQIAIMHLWRHGKSKSASAEYKAAHWVSRNVENFLNIKWCQTNFFSIENVQNCQNNFLIVRFFGCIPGQINCSKYLKSAENERKKFFDLYVTPSMECQGRI